MRQRTSLGTILLAIIVISVVAAPALADPTVTGDQGAWADLRAAWTKLHELSGYRAKMTSEDGVTGIMEFATPGAYHMTMQTKAGPVEMVGVNGKTAVKLNVPGAPAGWQCRDMPQPASVPDLEKAQGTINIARQPDTTVNGTPVHVYATSTTMPSSKAPISATWYVGSATGLPVRLTTGEAGHQSMMDFYDYGAAIAISLPSCG